MKRRADLRAGAATGGQTGTPPDTQREPAQEAAAGRGGSGVFGGGWEQRLQEARRLRAQALARLRAEAPAGPVEEGRGPAGGRSGGESGERESAVVRGRERAEIPGAGAEDVPSLEEIFATPNLNERFELARLRRERLRARRSRVAGEGGKAQPARAMREARKTVLAALAGRGGAPEARARSAPAEGQGGTVLRRPPAAWRKWRIPALAVLLLAGLYPAVLFFRDAGWLEQGGVRPGTGPVPGPVDAAAPLAARPATTGGLPAEATEATEAARAGSAAAPLPASPAGSPGAPARPRPQPAHPGEGAGAGLRERPGSGAAVAPARPVPADFPGAVPRIGVPLPPAAGVTESAAESVAAGARVDGERKPPPAARPVAGDGLPAVAAGAYPLPVESVPPPAVPERRGSAAALPLLSEPAPGAPSAGAELAAVSPPPVRALPHGWRIGSPERVAESPAGRAGDGREGGGSPLLPLPPPAAEESRFGSAAPRLPLAGRLPEVLPEIPPANPGPPRQAARSASPLPGEDFAPDPAPVAGPAPAPGSGRRSPVAPPPGRYTVLVHAPAGVERARVERDMAALRATGLGPGKPRRVGFRISRSNVRYFHPADRAAAARLAEAIGAQLRDFTSFRPQPPEGTIEVWLRGAPGRGAARLRARGGRGNGETDALEALRNRLIRQLRNREYLPRRGN